MTNSRILTTTIPGFLTIFIFLILLLVKVQGQNSYICRPDRTNPVLLNNQDSAITFPNEMDGFKFFVEGKLSAFTFGVTSIDEIRSMFGTPLRTTKYEETFDYDSDWLLIVNYYTSNLYGSSTRTSLDGVIMTKKNFIRPEYVGKIGMVRLRPKKNLQFNESSYPDKTVKPWKSKDESSNFYYNYGDRSGLTYKVIDREVKICGNLKEANVSLRQGDIMEIEYKNPCLLNKIYVEQ